MLGRRPVSLFAIKIAYTFSAIVTVCAAILLFRRFGGLVPGLLVASSAGVLLANIALRLHSVWSTGRSAEISAALSSSGDNPPEFVSTFIELSIWSVSWITTVAAISGAVFAISLFVFSYSLIKGRASRDAT